MMIRRLWVGAPLALLVAVLAHVAGFGRSHAPGAAHAWELLVVLGIALAALGSNVFFRAFAKSAWAGSIPSRFGSRVTRTPPSLAANVAALSALATIAYAALEFFEGHVAFGGSLRAALALVPIATLVAFVAPHAERTLRVAGSRIGATLFRKIAGSDAALATRRTHRVISHARARFGARRGRSPPHAA